MKVTFAETYVLLFLVTGFLVTAENSEPSDISTPSSWAKLELSPGTLVSMDYGNFGINIYEHASNRKEITPLEHYKYFFAPIALLDHKSAISFFNNVTKQPEMKFRIEMWNPMLKNKVVEFLSKFLKRQINDLQVYVIPFEKIILTSTSSSSSSFTISPEWKTIQKHQHVSFTLFCFSQEDCDRLATEMRSDPTQFDHFKLLFSLSSQTSQTKETVIRIENVLSGKMVTNLLQKFGVDQEEVYLTADDEKRMLTETATNIRIDTFDDSEMVFPNSEKEILKILRDLLIISQITIKKSGDKRWESVFWNNDNYRPDKSTKTLNKIYKKMDKEDQKKLTESYENTNKLGVSADVKLPTFKVASSFDSDFSRQGSNSSEELSKLFKESKDHVEWDGEQFVPKPMKLSRINLAKFRDTQSFHNRKVSVRYTTAVLSTPINFVQHSDLTVTDEWQSLKSTVENLKKTLNARTRDIVDIGKIPTSCSDLQQIGHVKSGLYSVMGAKTVETVYCNFFLTGQDMQKWIGYDDIKSLPTYFHVQRNTPFSIKNIPIPFHLEKLNVGKAMNLKSGKFTAPRAGTYYFSFTGVAQFSKSSTLLQFGISLYLNGRKIGMGWVEEANTAHLQSSPLAVHTTVSLKPGDEVWVQIWAMSTGVSLFECCDYYFTHFIGWVLEEDIATSLL